MKTLLIIIAFLNLSMVCKAQCTEKIEGVKLQKGMFLITSKIFSENDEKQYVAEVLTVNGSEFTCRFIHSNSIYHFKDFKQASNASKTLMQAAVVKNKGGVYNDGFIFSFNVYMNDPELCDLSSATETNPLVCIVTFQADNKMYLANMAKINGIYKMFFPHSKSTYEANEHFKVTKVKGGGYSIGSKIKIEHARLLVF